ncbi:multicomponent Na+:H+ antiporter subunit E [Rhodoglobus vestalii]|uniref:Multicomponent Na+:H+ antiporter subunit E n=1 Tax=Rhodoglobus vestalii TaxID=193384 RepID=A0A8H2PZH8_9MICO|nr:Na+/H+ antiporter subunit E [Rhodoglobus vestalii]TQO20708.1 multicomponent Na+:H+ antiporter subunit E [Rhodoglobus vestalii]
MTWASWPWRLLSFCAWFAKELVVANGAVIHDNLTPGQRSTTGIARFPTRCSTDTEITLLAALITLTPGTLTLGTTISDGMNNDEADPGTRVLFVHGMYQVHADELRDVLDDMETRLLNALRRKGITE